MVIKTALRKRWLAAQLIHSKIITIIHCNVHQMSDTPVRSANVG